PLLAASASAASRARLLGSRPESLCQFLNSCAAAPIAEASVAACTFCTSSMINPPSMAIAATPTRNVRQKATSTQTLPGRALWVMTMVRNLWLGINLADVLYVRQNHARAKKFFDRARTLITGIRQETEFEDDKICGEGAAIGFCSKQRKKRRPGARSRPSSR